MWDLNANGEEIRDYETKGSFGTCLDLVGCEVLVPLHSLLILTHDMKSADGRFIASGHENGSVYIFSTETGRMPFSLSGNFQISPK